MTDILSLSALLTAYNPRFADANYGIVVHWLSEGASFEHDVLPAIRFWTSRKADIYSLRFFTPYILKARDARLEREKPPVDGRIKAARIAFATRVVGKCLPRETAWLEAWERDNGRVKA